MLKPTPPKAAQPSQATQPPSTLRWLELSLYVALIAYLLHRYITVVPAYIDENCKGACKNYLKPGWMLGRKVDLTDHQWRVFRGNMPVLTGLALGHLLLSHFVRRLYAGADLAKQAQARLVFYAASAIVFVAGLHGIFALHVFVLVLGNYVLSKTLGSARFAPAIIWVYNLAVLFGIEWLADIKFVYLLGPSFEYLDSYSGFYRWHVSFNLVVLRMISFSMDHYWALQKQQGSPSSVVDEKTDKVSWTYEERVAAPQPLNVYNVWMYMAYLFYMPLHIAGPTITFNAFASQVCYWYFWSNQMMQPGTQPPRLHQAQAGDLVRRPCRHRPPHDGILAPQSPLLRSYSVRHLQVFPDRCPGCVQQFAVSYYQEFFYCRRPGLLLSPSAVAQTIHHLAILPVVGSGRQH